MFERSVAVMSWSGEWEITPLTPTFTPSFSKQKTSPDRSTYNRNPYPYISVQLSLLECTTWGERNALVSSGERSLPAITARKNRSRTVTVTYAPASGDPIGGKE